jgi:O-antigen/teichoic acid export membrane protein
MSLRPRIQKLATETAIYGVSSVFGRLINFLLFPLYSNVFSPEVYRPISLVYAAFIFLNIVYQYGMEAAYLKFAAGAKEDAGKKRVFSTSVWSLAATTACFTALMLVLQRPVGALLGLDGGHLKLLYYVAGILLLDTLAVVPYAELRLQNRPIRFAIVRTAGILVNITLNLVLILLLHMGIEAVFLANLASSAVSLLLLSPVFMQRLDLAFDRGLLRELLVFGLPFVPGGLGYAISDRVNLFFLDGMKAARVQELYGYDPAVRALSAQPNPEVYSNFIVGAYGGMVKLAIVMALVVQMFRYAWQPFFLQHADDEDAPHLFARIFTLLTGALLTVFLTVSFFARELVSIPLPGNRFLIAPEYWLGLAIVPVALLGYVFQGWYFHFSAGAYIRKKTGYFVVCTLAGSVLALALNILFVPRYGMAAAAWATTSSYALMAVMLWGMIRGRFPVPYEWGRTAFMGIAAAVIFLAWYLHPPLRRWWIELLLVTVFAVSVLAVEMTRGRRHSESAQDEVPQV